MNLLIFFHTLPVNYVFCEENVGENSKKKIEEKMKIRTRNFLSEITDEVYHFPHWSSIVAEGFF